MSQTTFGSDLFALSMGIKKSNKRDGKDRERYYTGIALSPSMNGNQKTTEVSPQVATKVIPYKITPAIKQAEQLLLASDQRVS